MKFSKLLDYIFMTKITSNAIENIKSIAKNNKKRLFFTFSLVTLENILFITYPVFGGFAVNAIMNGDVLLSLSYSLLVLIIWGIGAARRAVDTRSFARIYAELAVPVIINQREKGLNISAITARVALSRQFVDFFEQHLPTLIMSSFSIVGAAIMLLWLEFWSGITACLILVFFGLLLPKYSKTNDLLYLKLNDRLEKEVNVIEQKSNYHLNKHYDWLAYLRIGIASAILFGVTVVNLATTKGVQAGHIYAVITYLWTFAISLDDAPRLLEQFSNLKDIGKRVEV